jgi:hypothetical protein
MSYKQHYKYHDCIVAAFCAKLTLLVIWRFALSEAPQFHYPNSPGRLLQ